MPTQAERQRNNVRAGVFVLFTIIAAIAVIAVLGEGSRGRGYVVKDRVDDLDHLLGAIRTVAVGGSFIDDAVVDILIQARSRVVDSPLQALSPRELDVLAEIAAGRSNASVAESLHVSRHAVEKHTNAIFAKLGLTEDQEINRRVKAVLLFLSGQPAGETGGEPNP